MSFTSYAVFANDRGIEGVGGTFRVMKNEHPSIGMVSENIFMDIHPGYYDVIAEFNFKNFRFQYCVCWSSLIVPFLILNIDCIYVCNVRFNFISIL